MIYGIGLSEHSEDGTTVLTEYKIDEVALGFFLRLFPRTDAYAVSLITPDRMEEIEALRAKMISLDGST